MRQIESGEKRRCECRLGNAECVSACASDSTLDRGEREIG